MLCLKKPFTLEAAEDIINNSCYVVDPQTQKVRRPLSTEEWNRLQTVYVCNCQKISQTNFPILENVNNNNFVIKAGEECRCWDAYVIF
jgi:hypothetical protein